MREEAIVDLKIDDSEASAKWVENQNQIKEINKELRRLRDAGEEGSEGYKTLQKELRDVKAEQKDLTHNIDLSTASISQMQAAVNHWTKEAKQAEQGSAEWVQATKKIEEIKPILTEAQHELRSFGTEIEKQPGFWDNMKSSALGVFTGMGLFSILQEAGRALFDFGRSAVENFNEAAQSSAQMDAALESTGHSAGMTRAELDKLSESLSKKTRFDDDAINSSQALLLTFTDIKKGVYEQALPAILDMAEKMGGDSADSLKTTSIQVGKALNDPAHGISALAKVGVSFTEDQKEVIKSLQETGDKAGAQAIILQELQREFGGSAEAAAQAGTGGLTVLFNRLGNIKEGIGELIVTFIEGLYPTFSAVAGGIETVVNYIQDLITGNADLSESTSWITSVFNSLFDILKTVWNVIGEVIDIGAQLFGQLAKIADGLFETSGGAGLLEQTMALLAGAFRIAGSVLIVFMTGITALAEGLNVLINKGKEVANFFGSDFKIDTSATWANLNKHAEENITGINKLWEKSGDETVKTHEKVTKSYGASLDNQTKKTTEETKKQQQAKEKAAKAEADSIKRTEDLNIRAITNDTKRKKDALDLELKRKKENLAAQVKAGTLSKKQADNEIEALDRNHLVDIAKINDDARKKEEAEDLKFQKEAEKNKKIWVAFVKNLKERELKDAKEMLDAGFRQDIAQANLNLALAKDNSTAKWDAQKRLLEIEMAFKNKKIEEEAAAEIAQIKKSIANAESKKSQIENIEQSLANNLLANATKLEAEKVDVEKKAKEERKKNNDEFFGSVEKLMAGDFLSFTKYIKDKMVSGAKFIEWEKMSFEEKKEFIHTAATMSVKFLMDLNAKQTADKIAKLEAEKQKNIEKLKSDYDKGIITKDELDAGILEAENEFGEKSLVLKKKEFERNKKMQIAMAAIQGSMAVLNALATPPWLVGLVMAVTAGVKTAIDIKKIKNSKFEGRDGGTYFKNAGVARGSRHGSKYGDAGIVMHDRVTGREVGEIEGDEPVMVLSRDTYKNNGPLIEKLLHSSLHKRGAPIMARDGAMFVSETPFRYGEMMLFGAKKKKAAARAEMEAAQAEAAAMAAEADAAAGGAMDGDTAALIEQNTQISKDQLKAAEETAKNTADVAKILENHTGLLEKISNKDNGANSIMHAINSVQANLAKATLKG